MVAELCPLKMGNQVTVSGNLKNGLPLENLKISSSSIKKQGYKEKEIIGILSFEVANVMSKIIYLHKSLSKTEISKLKNEILKSEGILTLVSDDETKLLELVLVEKLDDLNRVASVVARLGKKCTIPALQGFEHVYGDIVSGVIDVKELAFLVKDMESRVRKMERYVNSTASLYSEMGVMNQLEAATKKFQQNHLEQSQKAFEQKLVWQKQDVRHLKDVSLWNQSYDKVVELLARTVCTIYGRICVIFGDALPNRNCLGAIVSRGKFDFDATLDDSKKKESLQEEASLTKLNDGKDFKRRSDSDERKSLRSSGTNHRPGVGIQRSEGGLFGPEDFDFACGMGPGRLFMECLSLSSSVSILNEENDTSSYDSSSQISSCFSMPSNMKREQPSLPHAFGRSMLGSRCNGQHMTNGAKFAPKNALMVQAPPSTVGGTALASRYANVIIVIEKLLRYPHLIGDEARDDLYHMLPTSLRKTLKHSLKAYSKDLSIYDAPLAHGWKERLDGILVWLAPLAHNMIRWQSEWNFEQQQIVTRTNVLLLQTLYFADRLKTEEAICQLLVGLNYICRYEQQQNALLDCSSSFDYEDCAEWQLQIGGSFQS